MIGHRALRATAILATLALASLALVLPEPTGLTESRIVVLPALMLTALFIEGLPINFPDRAAVTLSALPAALLWHDTTPYIAGIAVGAAVVLMGAARRQQGATITAACAILAVWLASHAVTMLPLSHLLGRQTSELAGIGLFCAIYGIAATALGAIVGDENPRPEAVSSLAMTPLVAVLAQITSTKDPMKLPIILLGGGAILLLVRGNINMLTLHRKVARLADHAEGIAQALTVERDTLAAVVNYSGDGIFTIDRDLRVRHFNPTLVALTGLREEMVVGRPIEEVLGAQHAPAVVGAALRRATSEGRAVRIESSLETPNGPREFVTSYTAVPAPGGGIALGVGGVHDVTEEKEQARIREDFFSLVTHDLRTPLTTMMGNTYLLDQELARSLDESTIARKLVGRVEEANEQLLRLVNNLLELQRIESGRDLMRLQPVFLRSMIEDLVEEFRDAAVAREMTVRLSGPNARAWGDPTWCHEILANLLNNAIKYTPTGGAIDLTVESAGGQVMVSVADTGHGLLPEEREQLFTKFFRSKRPEIRSARGTGLGLALAKRMAERMGGDISVRSTVGVGSTFTVMLPLGDLPPFVEGSDHVKEVAEPAIAARSM